MRASKFHVWGKSGFIAALLGTTLTLGTAMAAPYLYAEPTGNVRFEQYTNGGPLVLWRLPYPGASTFPGGSCTAIAIPGTTEQNRFFAIYMQTQTLDQDYIIQYETSNCQVISFGMEY
jgi:hypothetical protein